MFEAEVLCRLDDIRISLQDILRILISDYEKPTSCFEDRDAATQRDLDEVNYRLAEGT